MFAYQYLRRYNEATDLYFALRQSSATNALPPSLSTAPVFVAGDCVISKDGAAFANTTNLPTSIGNGLWKLTLTAAETQGTNVDVMVNDATVPQVWIGCHLHIETRLRLRSVNVSNDAGDGVTFESTGSNGKGLVVTGQGSGHAALFTAGATGDGIQSLGGATSGAGIKSAAVGGGNGISALGIGSGDGFDSQGGTTGRGIDATGGATSGEGIRATAQAGNDEGFLSTGQGTGAGILGQGGVSGNGIHGIGGATAGNGLRAESLTNSPGGYFKAAGVGAGAHALQCEAGGGVGAIFTNTAGSRVDIGGNVAGMYVDGGALPGFWAASAGVALKAVSSTTHGAQFISAGNGDALQLTGSGTGAGLLATAGATGKGAYFKGGVTSGPALQIEGIALSADGLNIISNTGVAMRATGGVGAYLVGSGGSTALGGSNAGMYVEGIGAFHGIYAKAMVTGDAMRVEAALNGIGLNCIALGGNAAGAKFTGFGTGAGIEVTGGATGDAMTLTGGAGKAGLRCTAGGNGHGMAFLGSGSGHGATFIGGATGHGLNCGGGATSGNGINAQSTTLGHGFRLQGAGIAGHGFYASAGAGANSHGMLTQGGVAGGNGLRAEGLNTSSGIYGLAAGATHGIEGSPDIFPLAAAFWDENMGAEPVAALADNPTFRSFFSWLGIYMFNKATQNATTRTFFKNDSTTPVGTQAVSFDGTTQNQGKLS